MKSLTKALLILVLTALVGFTIMNEENKMNESSANEDITLVNEEDVTLNNSIINYTNKGEWTASWYGPKFHGKVTANGEIYDQMAFTAAHKSLTFGTLLRVTNAKTKRSVIVRINDRGPYIRGRQLDLSKAAALQLGMVGKGVQRVNIEQISLKGINLPVVTLN
ncbi:MAG: septal ring lytic transglycosylase RlpA family protein [Ignavibacteriaceae bacterium]